MSMRRSYSKGTVQAVEKPPQTTNNRVEQAAPQSNNSKAKQTLKEEDHIQQQAPSPATSHSRNPAKGVSQQAEEEEVLKPTNMESFWQKSKRAFESNKDLLVALVPVCGFFGGFALLML